MKETPISVTLAARNFADCINLVRYKGITFLLEKNGVPVARLMPVQSEISSDLEQLTGDHHKERKDASPAQGEDQNKETRTVRNASGRDLMKDKETSVFPKRPTLNW